MDQAEELKRLSEYLSTQLEDFLSFAEAELQNPAPTEHPQEHDFVVYAGEFAPFHMGNYLIYRALQEQFTPDRVFLATPEKGLPEKIQLITTTFHIPEQKIRGEENPLIPKSVLEQFNLSSDVYILAVSPEDATIVEQAKYYQRYIPDVPHVTFGHSGYFLTTPAIREQPPKNTGNAFGKNDDNDGNDGADGDAIGTDDGNATNTAAPKQKFVGGKLPKKKGTQHPKADDPAKNKNFGKTDVKKPRDKNMDSDSEKQVPVMQKLVLNPDTHRMIKVASGLKYPRSSGGYRAALSVTTQAGIDRPNRRDDDDLHIQKLYNKWKDKKKTNDK